MALPSFVVLGAQKSASTYLQDLLALHPQVSMVAGEVRAFEDPYYALGGPAALESRLSDSPHSVWGIKRPDYLSRPEIPERLREHLPSAKLLVVLREPVARAVSAYFHMVRHGFVPLRPLDEAFAILLAEAWSDTYPRASEILSYGRYGEHLGRYLEYYPPEQLMVFDQAEVTQNPRQALLRAFSFLGVDPGFEIPAQEKSVSNKGIYSPIRLRVLRTKNRWRYSYAEDLSRREPRSMTPWGWAYNAGVVGLDRAVLSRLDSPRPPDLSTQVKLRVDEYYEADRQQLKGLIGQWSVDVPWL